MSSPVPRAWRTAEILTEEAGWPAPERCRALEAGGSATRALDALRPHARAPSVAVVGHEPNLSELASTLLTGSATRLQLEMKKGGVALVRIEGEPRRGSAWLAWLLTPKALRSLGR
jgi:phosphohistidine phosphatase